MKGQSGRFQGARSFLSWDFSAEVGMMTPDHDPFRS